MQPGVGDHAPFDLERAAAERPCVPFGPATAGVFPVLAEEIAVTVQRDVRPRPELHGGELFEHVRVIPAEVFPARADGDPVGPHVQAVQKLALGDVQAIGFSQGVRIYIDGENFQGMRQDIGDDPETWSTSCW
jgi:hypothetical protein